MRRRANRLTDVFDLGFSQTEVDFVIPDLGQDLRLAIDPFLLFKSRDDGYRSAHDLILSVFNETIRRFGHGDEAGARRLVNFPEVNEIGFGYSEAGIRGSGLGQFLNELVLQTLAETPALVERGVRHVEELQLVSVGIGPDRISDLAANILKSFLISYTQHQAAMWKIPTEKDVAVHNVFKPESFEWEDGYYQLPRNPLSTAGRAILLVPRRIVRTLPWINFEDYQRLEFGSYLRAKEVRRVLPKKPREPALSKNEIVAVTRREIRRIDHYVDAKERDRHRADPELPGISLADWCGRSEKLRTELQTHPSGESAAAGYQDLMFRVFNFLFEPDLIEGRTQVRTVHGTQIRDLIYTNDSDKPFWTFIRTQHGGLSVVVELKNKDRLDIEDVDQIASYLGDPMGYFGILVSREPMSSARRLTAMTWYNKGSPHRVIVSLADVDVTRMLEMKCAGKDPSVLVRQAYQDFLSKMQ
jgi:hypothetical protein